MSSFNIPGADGTGGLDEMEPDSNFESLFAQLRGQSGAGADSPDPGPEAPSHFTSYNHGSQSFYGEAAEGPAGMGGNNFPPNMDYSAFPPAAPTPPVHGPGSHSHFPPGLAAMGGNTRGPGNNQRSHLLNLLKFSGQEGQSAQQHSPQHMQQHSPQNALQHAPQYAPQPIPHQAPREQLSASHADEHHPPPAVIHAPAPAAADPSGLLAALMKGNHQAEQAKPEPPVAPAPSWNNTTSPSSNTQQYLLNLLNRPKPSQTDASSEHSQPKNAPGITQAGASAENTPVSARASRSSRDPEPKHRDSPPTKFESSPRSQQGSTSSKPGIFGYANPFEDLAATSPLNRTPKSSTTQVASSGVLDAGDSAATINFFETPDYVLPVPGEFRNAPEHTTDKTGQKTEHIRSPLSHPASQRTPSDHSATSASLSSAREGAKNKNKGTVAEAVSSIAQKVNNEAQEALTRAEEEQAQAEIARDLDNLLNAKSDEEFEESAHVAAQAIKKELDKDENKTALENTLSPGVADAVKEIIDETAEDPHDPVADSWESAETDQIVVIEESSTPVEVINFPIKPWIAISLGDDQERARPIFRDEATLDIARLKKDFDQIDRNLITASETYMVYGMSKHGGLRVIRQDDGLDAKLFTDTHDRIFNVAMSSTPSDQNITPKEAILGTGVSGAVYWVLIKDGGKDHLDDAHLEQYGFVLPPVSNQEGDTPGGVLKTRARTSSTNPEYFAVGRGKSINIIWPSFILDKNLFKPGHDRVVDTEKLFKQCSLKINTGKAGKDFTFSQDDTTVVSLDKSGRVKFWDVRDLTSAAEDSDPRNPMPAHTAVEVKDPMLTLTTTPEGEKAWPTSVLLLDKLRPYQKRTALRYMVVGMKQNHTLQLWDLALGKAVQEFNLPHSNESDAVCSVMYNPATGMIVVGHPTRNSIYFLHLSAPKYNLKNLSQVDYIQRLVNQDTSIPQPESTAVISGMREFSFATKGILRSLDILQNPTTASSTDDEEPTLFELYSMHSKGVTCLFIKRSELGWTKDNKVMQPVDSSDASFVSIGKLTPSAQPTESHVAVVVDPAASSQVRLAARNSVKDALQKTPSSQGDERKGPESTTPAKLGGERKEEETPVQQPEKSEKKGRKRKALAAAAAAREEREFLVASNGASNSQAPQAKASTTKAAGRAMEPTTLASTSLSAEAFEALVKSMEFRLGHSMSTRLDTSLAELVNQLNDQQKVREGNFMSIQETLLHMVSDVLNENTEAVLKHTIKKQFDETVIPVLGPMLRENIDEKLDEVLREKFEGIDKSFRETVDDMSRKFVKDRQSAQREALGSLPDAVGHALKQPDITRMISDRVTQNISNHIGDHISSALSNIIPTLSTITAQAVQNVGGEVNRLQEEIAHLERQRHADQAKIDQLVAQTTHLSTMISTMAASQSQIQKEFISLKQQTRDRDSQAHGSPAQAPAHSRGSVGSQSFTGHPSRELVAYNQQGPSSQEHPQHAQSQHLGQQHPGPHHAQPQHTQPQHTQPQHAFPNGNRELEQAVQTMDNLMRNGNYDEAMMRWLQSGNNEEELFKQVIVKYSPTFVTDLQPLLLLSVGATISADLDGPNVAQKLAITEMVIYSFNQMINNLVCCAHLMSRSSTLSLLTFISNRTTKSGR